MPEGQLQEGYLLNDRYRIVRVIGRGGMGTVYEARHEVLNAVLAVKEISGTTATGTAQQDTMEQYEQEARFLVPLNHPNLPKVNDAFVDGDRFYLVMEFVEGVTLDEKLRELGGTAMDPHVVVEWAIQIAEVLRYLHAQDPPIIFRDLKPSNIMVQPDGRIKLIDFGIARRFQPGASHDTVLLGSVGYSPPEQFGKNQTDTRSDIYAFGATLHHLLTARDPSTGPFKFKPVDQINLAVPMSLSQLIAKCLSMEADDRPHDVASVSSSLKEILNDLDRTGGYSKSAVARPQPDVIHTSQASAPRTMLPQAVHTVPTSSENRSTTLLRIAAVALSLVLIAGVCALALRSNSDKRKMAGQPRSSSARGAVGGKQTALTQQGDQAASTSAGVPDPSSSASPQAGTNPPADPASGKADSSSHQAVCRVEVVGPSPDGKSIRLHITGQINGKDGTAGMVAAYFYNADQSPMAAADPKGPNASPTGQLFSEFTFQIDADSKPFDGTMDVPIDQFATMIGVQFRCIVYADNQSAGETQLLPLTTDTAPDSGSRPNSQRSGVGNRVEGS